MAEDKKKRIKFEKKAAAASDVETLVDDVFGNLKGKKADEIVDSLKLSGGNASRRKKGNSRRIGAGGQNRRQQVGEMDDAGDQDDALAAMMSKLGVDSK
jgi:hypothetical protein